jgi:hypothetical protein
VLAFEHIQPGRVGGLGIGPLEQSEEEAGVAISAGWLLATHFQALQPELPHRLQHPEARLALGTLFLTQQALVD